MTQEAYTSPVSSHFLVALFEGHRRKRQAAQASAVRRPGCRAGRNYEQL